MSMEARSRTGSRALGERRLQEAEIVSGVHTHGTFHRVLKETETPQSNVSDDDDGGDNGDDDGDNDRQGG